MIQTTRQMLCVAGVLCGMGVAHAAPPASSSVPAPASDAPAKESWVATHTLSPGSVVQADDVEIRPGDTTVYGAFSLDRTPVGMDVKHRILADRPILERDVRPHALVHANATVHMSWRSAGISMEMTGRALQNGAVGDPIRVMNTTSSRTLHGTVQPDGSVLIGGGE